MLGVGELCLLQRGERGRAREQPPLQLRQSRRQRRDQLRALLGERGAGGDQDEQRGVGRRLQHRAHEQHERLLALRLELRHAQQRMHPSSRQRGKAPVAGGCLLVGWRLGEGEDQHLAKLDRGGAHGVGRRRLQGRGRRLPQLTQTLPRGRGISRRLVRLDAQQGVECRAEEQSRTCEGTLDDGGGAVGEQCNE